MKQLKAFNALTQTRYGLMLCHQLDHYVGLSLMKYGEYAPREIALLSALLRPGDVVIDGGANQGALTLPLSLAVGDAGAVFAFEPQRLTYQVLCANIALNSRPNVQAFQVALGEAEGAVQIAAPDLTRPCHVGGVAVGATGATVPQVTVDSLELPRLRLLKLDIEGMERPALRGAAATVARCQPILYLENDKAPHELGLLEDVNALGYRMFWHLTGMFEPDNFRGDDEDIFAQDGNPTVNFNLLGLPPGDDQDMTGFLEARVGEDHIAMLARVNAPAAAA